MHKSRFPCTIAGIGCDEIRADMTGRDVPNAAADEKADNIQAILSNHAPKAPTCSEVGSKA
jgi:hypothetical protein